MCEPHNDQEEKRVDITNVNLGSLFLQFKMHTYWKIVYMF